MVGQWEKRGHGTHLYIGANRVCLATVTQCYYNGRPNSWSWRVLSPTGVVLTKGPADTWQQARKAIRDVFSLL